MNRTTGIMRLIALVFLLCILSPTHSETLVGRVVGVHDGDTLTLLDAQKRQTKVRAEIARTRAPSRMARAPSRRCPTLRSARQSRSRSGISIDMAVR